MHTYHPPKSQQNSSAVVSKKERSFTFLQKIVLCALLFATLLLTPAAAVPTADTQDAQISWKCTNPHAHICKYVSIGLLPNETFFPPSAGRDLKLRTSLKKPADFLYDCSCFISTTGDVCFMNSPVVTGLHLPDGVTGNVHLQMTAETSRPEFCHVYQVFELSLENYPVGSETLVRYTLPLAEIEEKGYNPVDIALCLYENNIWQKLQTIYFMDEQNAHFESVTTSLGTFAIISDGNFADLGETAVRIGTPPISPAVIAVCPACFVTHPVSYTVPV